MEIPSKVKVPKVGRWYKVYRWFGNSRMECFVSVLVKKVDMNKQSNRFCCECETENGESTSWWINGDDEDMEKNKSLQSQEDDHGNTY